mgnify:CR=1 FL=1
MNKKLKGGVVIYMSLIVMFIGMAILYILNTSGTTNFQNFKTTGPKVLPKLRISNFRSFGIKTKTLESMLHILEDKVIEPHEMVKLFQNKF